jgi:DnaJ family protein A protein 2
MGGGMSAEDLFSQIFGGGMFGGRSQPRGPRRGKDVGHTLAVSLEDLYKGKVSKLALQKQVICGGCEGRGGKEGAVKTCDTCNGQGIKVVLRQMGPMVQQIQQTCPDCRGEGEIIREKDRCKQCYGRKIVNERKTLQVYIDKGMKDGQRITFNGEADQAPGIIPGDVVIILEQKEHPRFKRKGDDLFYEAKIDLLTALAGGHFAIEHLDGRVLNVEILPGEVIRPNELKVIEREGMPSHRHQSHGNMYIKFDIEFPAANWASPEQIAQLEHILPARPQNNIPQGDNVEEVVLSAMDPVHHARAEREAQSQEEDDGMPQGHGVQCAQQ